MKGLFEATLALLAMISIPLALLNFIGGIVGGIWLGVLGEWAAIGLGIAILFIGAWAASLMLAPGMLLAAFGAAMIERGNKFVGWLIVALSSPWTTIIIIVWQIAIFRWFGKYVDTENAIPMWLWSYGAATGVWSYMASKEPADSHAPITAFASQISYIVLSVCVIYLDWTSTEAIYAMIVPLLMPLALAIGIAAMPQRPRPMY